MVIPQLLGDFKWFQDLPRGKCLSQALLKSVISMSCVHISCIPCIHRHAKPFISLRVRGALKPSRIHRTVISVTQELCKWRFRETNRTTFRVGVPVQCRSGSWPYWPLQQLHKRPHKLHCWQRIARYPFRQESAAWRPERCFWEPALTALTALTFCCGLSFYLTLHRLRRNMLMPSK